MKSTKETPVVTSTNSNTSNTSSDRKNGITMTGSSANCSVSSHKNDTESEKDEEKKCVKETKTETKESRNGIYGMLLADLKKKYHQSFVGSVFCNEKERKEHETSSEENEYDINDLSSSASDCQVTIQEIKHLASFDEMDMITTIGNNSQGKDNGTRYDKFFVIFCFTLQKWEWSIFRCPVV